jgi:hypothetical protein
MTQADNFLHTNHRTVSWFNKTFASGELELAAPFQRNPVWTVLQQAYLIDTILLGLPIPELYMQDLGDEEGVEQHIVVDRFCSRQLCSSGEKMSQSAGGT